jgi:hypothetical protein
MTLTQLQLERLRRDLGDIGHSFTDPELNDNYDRMDSAPNDHTRFEAVKGLCFEQLLNSSTKLHDYSAGAVDEKLSQIVKNLEKRLDYYLPAMQAALGENRQLVVGKLGIRINPDRYTPSENWNTGNPRRRNKWG